MEKKDQWYLHLLMESPGIQFKDPSRADEPPLRRLDPCAFKTPYFTQDDNSVTRYDEVRKADLNNFLTIYFPLLFA